MNGSLTRALLALALILLALSGVTRAAVTVQCRVDPPEINVGDQAMVSYTIQGGSVDDFQLPRVDGLTPGEMQTSSQISLDNGNFSQSVVKAFGVVPTHAGTFIIPAFNIRTSDGQTLKTQALTLHVVGAAGSPAPSNPSPTVGPVVLPPSTSAAQPPAAGADPTSTLSVPTDANGQPARVFQIVTPETTDAYVGQSVPLRIEFFIQVDANAQQDSLPVLIGSDFLMNNLSLRPQQDEVNVGDQEYLRETWVTAIAAPKAGDFPLQATRDTYWNKIGAVVNNDPFGQLFGRPAQLVHQEVASNRLVMHVHALPDEERPANFTGAIGKFEATGNAVPSAVGVGEPVTLRFTITGQGNFDYVRCPSLTPDSSWKTYTPTSKTNYEDEAHTQAMKTFEQALIPRKNGVVALPPASFSYFDPTAKHYVTIPVTLPSITVTGQEAVATTSQPASASASGSPAPLPTVRPDNVFAPNQLSFGMLTPDLAPGYRHAWFWIIQLALLAAIFAGLALPLFRPRGNPQRTARALRFASLRQEREAMSAAARDGDAVRFFTAARRVVQLQLAEQWQIAPETVSPAEMARRDPALAETLTPLFTEADHVIYSGNAHSNVDLAEWNRRVSEIIQPAARV